MRWNSICWDFGCNRRYPMNMFSRSKKLKHHLAPKPKNKKVSNIAPFKLVFLLQMNYCLRKDVYASANYSLIFRQRVHENKSKSCRILTKEVLKPNHFENSLIPRYELRIKIGVIFVFSIFLCIWSYFFYVVTRQIIISTFLAFRYQKEIIYKIQSVRLVITINHNFLPLRIIPW